MERSRFQLLAEQPGRLAFTMLRKAGSPRSSQTWSSPIPARPPPRPGSHGAGPLCRVKAWEYIGPTWTRRTNLGCSSGKSLSKPRAMVSSLRSDSDCASRWFFSRSRRGSSVLMRLIAAVALGQHLVERGQIARAVVDRFPTCTKYRRRWGPEPGFRSPLPSQHDLRFVLGKKQSLIPQGFEIGPLAHGELQTTRLFPCFWRMCSTISCFNSCFSGRDAEVLIELRQIVGHLQQHPGTPENRKSVRSISRAVLHAARPGPRQQILGRQRIVKLFASAAGQIAIRKRRSPARPSRKLNWRKAGQASPLGPASARRSRANLAK